MQMTEQANVMDGDGVYNVELDRSGACTYLMVFSSCFYCVGCLFAFPCIKCYSDSQSVSINDKSVTLSYDLGICGNSTKSVPLDRIQDISVSQNFCGKITGTTNLSIQTAGSGGPQAEIVVIAPVNATMVRDELTHRRDAMVGHAGEGGTVSDGLGGTSSRSPLLGGSHVEMNDTLSRIESLIKEGLQKI